MNSTESWFWLLFDNFFIIVFLNNFQFYSFAYIFMVIP